LARVSSPAEQSDVFAKADRGDLETTSAKADTPSATRQAKVPVVPFRPSFKEEVLASEDCSRLRHRSG
jgi:hypothetical protein